MLKLTVPGEPIAKARPRMTRMGRTYTPAKTVSYETLIKECFASTHPGHVPVEAISAWTLFGALKTAGVLGGDAELNSADTSGGTLRLDFNDAFARQVSANGTAGEYMLLGSVVNTYLAAFGASGVVITVNGGTLESGHQIYNYTLTRYADNVA